MRTAAVLGLLALAAIVLWVALSRPGAKAPEPASNASDTSTSEPQSAAPAATLRPAVAAAPASAAVPASAAADTVEPEHQPGDPSHPITEEHRRVYRDNQLRFSVDNAVLVKDYEAIRRFNAQYRKEFPEKHALQEGYDLIADCLEEKTPERVERARKYWETRRSSVARRDVRHICLE